MPRRNDIQSILTVFEAKSGTVVYQDRLGVPVKEGFSAGEVILLDGESLRFLEQPFHIRQLHELEGMVGGATRDEAMGAGEVTERTRHLEPEVVESGQLGAWSVGRGGGHDAFQLRSASEERASIRVKTS